MSQYDFGNLESPLTGTALINTHLEPWRNALHSGHSGSSTPSYAVSGMVWNDTTSNPVLRKYFDGSDNITIGRINATENTMTHVGHLRSQSSAGIILYDNSGTSIATLGAGGGTTVTFAGQVNFSGLIKANGKFTLADAGELTIATGAITITAASHTVDTESDAASDDLDTINGGADGAIVTLRPAHTDRTVVLKHGIGNIQTPFGTDVVLDSTDKAVVLQYDLELTKWLVLALPANLGNKINAIGSIGGGTQDIDLTAGRVVTGTVDTSTTTFTFSNPLSGVEDGFILHLTNGGSQTVNWPASVDWAGGTAPSLTAAGVDALVFQTLDGGTTWYGFLTGGDMS